MEYRLIEHPLTPYVECLPDGGLITSEREALDLVAACGEYGAPRLLIHAANLPPAFYDLRTGLAGAVLLKFATYRVKVAALLTPALVEQGRFHEMALEANRANREFHIFYDYPAAHDWLLR